jgi:hypothetical protein
VESEFVSRQRQTVFLFFTLPTGSGAHPPSYVMVTGSTSPGIELSLPPFITKYLIRHKDGFAFYFAFLFVATSESSSLWLQLIGRLK